MPTLAVLINVVDSLPHEAIWHRWLRDPSSARSGWRGHLHIHAAKPGAFVRTSTWLANHTLPISYQPHYDDYRLVRAQLALAERALEGGADFLVFATESCVPLTPLADAGAALARQPGAWLGHVATRPPPSDPGVERVQWRPVNTSRGSGVRPGSVAKGGGTAMAFRAEDARLLLENEAARARAGKPAAWAAFRDVFAPEEIYFATMLRSLNASALVWRQPTYLIYPGGTSHPVSFRGLNADFVHCAVCAGYPFARKLPPFPLETHIWDALVLPPDGAARGNCPVSPSVDICARYQYNRV